MSSRRLDATPIKALLWLEDGSTRLAGRITISAMRSWRLILLAGLGLASQGRGDAVDDLMRDAMRQHPIPGAALAIVRGGQTVKTAAYGMANLERRAPATPETVFEIGSVTKQFTAAAILLLAQEGKLAVDDKISRYLKDTPASWSRITIRQLLTHTSGLKNYTGLAGFELARHLTQAQFISLKSPPIRSDFPPGEKWSYCNTGYNLLGYIIENVSGKSYGDFLEQNIFAPLGMTATTRREPGAILPLRASGYETNRAGQFIIRDPDLTDVFSAGALVSTVGDLAKWNAALDTDGILTAASRAADVDAGEIKRRHDPPLRFRLVLGAVAGPCQHRPQRLDFGFFRQFATFPGGGFDRHPADQLG